MNRQWLPLALAASFAIGAQAADRPLLPVFANAAEVNARCDAGMEAAQKAIAAFSAAPANAAQAATALRRWDALNILIEDFSGPMDILAAVATTAEVRDAADACNVRVAKLANELFQNARAYDRIRLVRKAGGPDAALRTDLIEGFEDAGVALPEEKRRRAREILDRLAVLAVDFQKNTREKRSTIAFTAAEMAGLPPAYLERHKPDADGRYTLSMDYTDYFPFMENAESGDARRRYLDQVLSKGGEEPPQKMVRKFLGREPSPAAFFAEITGERR